MAVADTTEAQELYNIILLRDGSAADLDWWQSILDAGQPTPARAQAQIVDAFATSAEAAAYVYPIVDLYQAFFERTPDADGFRFWMQAFHGGEPLLSIATSFAQVWGNGGGTAADFVSQLYESLFGRNPDTPGLNAWVSFLNANGNAAAAQAQVALDFMQSAEFQGNLPAWNASIAAWLEAAAQYDLTNAVSPPQYPGSIVSSGPAQVNVKANGDIGSIAPFALTNVVVAVDPSVTSISANWSHLVPPKPTAENILSEDTLVSFTVTGGSAATHFQIGNDIFATPHEPDLSFDFRTTTVFGGAAFQSLDASGYLGQLSVYLDPNSMLPSRSYIAGSAAGNFLFETVGGGSVSSFGGKVVDFQTVEIFAQFGGSISVGPQAATTDTPAVAQFGVNLLNASHFAGISVLELAGNDMEITGLPVGVAIAIGDQGNQGYEENAALPYGGLLPIVGGPGGIFVVGNDLVIDVQNPASGLDVILNAGTGYNGVDTGSPGLTLISNAAGTLTFNAPEVILGQSFDLAIVDGSATSLVFTGGQAGQVVALDQNGVPASVSVIDASALASNFIMAPDSRYFESPAAGPPSLTVTGGSGSNVIELANAGDNLNGGTGTNNTLIINVGMTNGPYTINLGAPGNEVAQFDQSGTPPTAINFTNLDMSAVGAGTNGIQTATINVTSTGGSAYNTSSNGTLVQKYDFAILSPNLDTTVNLSSSPTASSTIVVFDGSTLHGLDGAANSTFTNYDTITGFGGANGVRSGTAADQFGFTPSYAATLVNGNRGIDYAVPGANGIVVSTGGGLTGALTYMLMGSAPTSLISEASVIATIGTLVAPADARFTVVEFNNPSAASATQFGVYEIDTGSAHSGTPLGAGDTIKLLGLFNTSNGWDGGLFFHTGAVHSV